MTHKLLLADGSVAIQRVIELTFAAEDVEVVSVSDGDEAVARIPLERPDIVLADIGMTKRSGYDVAAFVKQRADLSHIPVLLLAGAFEPVDESRAAQVKSDGVLVKPFEPRQVIARVRELVAGVKRPAPAVAAPVQGAPHRLPGAERRTPIPAPGQDARPRDGQPAPGDPWAADESLDRYFDRLDAALSTRGSTPPAAGRQTATSDEMDPFVEGAVPTVDDVLSDASLFTPPDEALTSMRMSAAPPADAPSAGGPPTAAAPSGPAPVAGPAAPPSRSAAPTAGDPAMAAVFSALFAAEQGEPGAVRIQLGTPASPVVTDDLVEQVTRRVVARLAPDAARSLVADVVSEVAERLVREEIARIRSK